MSEPETLDLAEEFARYRRTVLAEVEAPGPAAVRRTVRRRSRRRLAATATAALALFGGSALGYAAMSGPDHRPGPVEPTPSVSASPTPTPTPTQPPALPGPAPARPPTVPDGRISRAQLLGAPVTLPAWRAGPGCPTSQTRLTADAREGANSLLALDHGDVDGDGAVETVALVQCVLGTRGPMQVVAFDRDKEGKVITRRPGGHEHHRQAGVAVRAGCRGRRHGPGAGRGHRSRAVAGTPSGHNGSGGATAGTGDAFSQVSGPTSFGPNPHLVNLVGHRRRPRCSRTRRTAPGPARRRCGSATSGTAPAAHVALRLGVPRGAARGRRRLGPARAARRRASGR